MSLIDSIERREKSILNELREKQAGINDPNGKGAATERIVQAKLIEPFLPPRFGCLKGAIVSSTAPLDQSAAIDRIIYDRAACMPLVYDEDHFYIPDRSRGRTCRSYNSIERVKVAIRHRTHDSREGYENTALRCTD